MGKGLYALGKSWGLWVRLRRKPPLYLWGFAKSQQRQPAGQGGSESWVSDTGAGVESQPRHSALVRAAVPSS